MRHINLRRLQNRGAFFDLHWKCENTSTERRDRPLDRWEG
jgi:hypothetical protein